MSSWRDTTPQAVQDDLDNIAGIGVEAAQTSITKSGVLSVRSNPHL
jgi:hypothetical protein